MELNRGLQWLGAASTIALLAAASLPGAAYAQTVAQPPADQVEEVVVTGSRIAKRDFVSDSPIVTVQTKALQDVGSVEVEQKLARLPQFSPGATQFQTSLQNGNVGAATLNLRNLGATRNLVLVDGRRAQPSGANMQIDVNSLPAALIEGVEVISGGASAVYGSDAVSGVINFKLKRRFSGFEVSSQYGVGEKGDGRTYDLSLTAGGNFADNRGNAVLSLGYFQRDAIPMNARGYFSRAAAAGLGGSNILPTGVYTPTTAGPIGPADLSPPYLLPGGNAPSAAALATLFNGYGVSSVVTPATSLGFNPDGTLFTANNGVRNYKGPGLDGGYYADRTGQLVYNNQVSDLTLLTAPLKRWNGFAHVDYDLNDAVSVYGQAMLTSYRTITQQADIPAGFNVWNLVVPVSNPFIPTDLRTLLASRAQPNAPFSIMKSISEFGPRTVRHDTTLYQVLAGVRGTVPGQDWTWDAYGSYGRTEIDQTTTSGAVSYKALESLLFAADGGNAICAGGFNPFRSGSVSGACKTLVSRDAPSISTSDQYVVEATLQGGLFDLPAGRVRFAVGADYRRNSSVFRNDSVLNRALPSVDYIALAPSASTVGATSVKEIYGELNIPLLRNLPGVKELSIDPAYRYSDYSNSGGVSAYKVDFNWTVIDQVRLRGGYQRAIRAPNIGELFAGAISNAPLIGFTFQGQGDPCDVTSRYRSASNPDAARVRALCVSQGVPAGAVDSFSFPAPQVGGSIVSRSDLQPEEADTFTAGVVLRPAFDSPLLSRLTLSVDFYDISIKDAINYIPATSSLYNCFNNLGSNPTFDANNLYCQQITRSAGGQIVSLNTRPVNAGGIKTRGEDIQLDWSVDLESLGLDPSSGTMALNVVATHLERFQIANLPGAAFLEYAGTLGVDSGPLPEWRTNTTLSYQRGPATIGLRWSYLASMDSSTKITSPTAVRPGVPSYNTFDLFGRWALSQDVELRGGVTNLFDKKPLDVDGNPGQTNPSVYDPLGRRFYVAATLRF